MIQEFDLRGRTALVIGAGGCLGRQQASGLARAGANLALADLHTAPLADLCLEIERLGRKVRSYAIDITDPEAVRRMSSAVNSDFKRIDILVNSAGVTRRAPSEEFSGEVFDRILDINLNGVFYACQAVGRCMMLQGGGRIINVGSIFSTVGAAESPAYAVSKGAVAQLTRTLAIEWAPYRIAVNAILPSWLDTPMGNVANQRKHAYKGSSKLPSSQELEERTIGRVPLRRLGKPSEIVGATILLASDAASLITGHLLAIDGGFLAQ